MGLRATERELPWSWRLQGKDPPSCTPGCAVLHLATTSLSFCSNLLLSIYLCVPVKPPGKNTSPWTGDMAQTVQCVLDNREDLISTPRTYI